MYLGYSMGAPQWGQNLLSLTAPQMGHAFSPAGAPAAGSSRTGLLASSSAIFALEAFTA